MFKTEGLQASNERWSRLGQNCDTTNDDTDGDNKMGGTKDNSEVVERLKAPYYAKKAMTREPPQHDLNM